MFDYMIRVLDNGRLLVRNNTDNSSKVLKANEISPYFENVLEVQIRASRELDDKIEAIKNQAENNDETES